jgi:hypothetical protein
MRQDRDAWALLLATSPLVATMGLIALAVATAMIRRSRSVLIRFPIERSLWELWDLLEKHGVVDVWLDEWTPSDDPFHIVVEVYKDEARLRVPEGVLKSEDLLDLMGLFVEAYRGHHVDWERMVRKDYEVWLELAKRHWVEHGMSPEEAEKKKQELLKSLEESIKEEAKKLEIYADFAKSLFELMYPRPGERPRRKRRR